MKTIAFIPARGGSKSIPLKNIMLVAGKPLIYWTLKAAGNCPLIDEVYLATDSEKIAKVALSFNFKKLKIYHRNPKNAEDTSSTESVMLEFLENNKFDNEDNFILVQATSPLTTSSHLTAGINQYKSENTDSLLTCVRSKRFFWNESGNAVNYDYKNRPRRQDFSGILMENGAFYINKVKNILKDKNRLSGKISIYEMEEYTAVEIDEELDLLLIEKLMEKYSR